MLQSRPFRAWIGFRLNPHRKCRPKLQVRDLASPDGYDTPREHVMSASEDIPLSVEKIKFDLLGHRRLLFDEEGVTYATDELYPVPLPLGVGTVKMSSEGRILYADVRWVGILRKKQWWALVMAFFGWGLGLFWIWATAREGDPGPIGFSVVFLVLFGMFPTWLFVQGRKFLAIASDSECISFPADRKRKQVRRALDSLRARCRHENVEWQLGHGAEADVSWSKETFD